MRRWAVVALFGLVASGLGSSQAVPAQKATRVYFDQTEEENYWSTDMAPFTGLPTKAIVPSWDPNGQLCLFPDGSGRFAVGYNPTGTDQTWPDGKQLPGALLPRKQPPVGVAIYDRNGTFTGRTLYVPGPYKLTPKSSQWTSAGVAGPDAGGDIPPDPTGASSGEGGPFNSEGTYTGCAFSPTTGNLFAVDIGTSQGGFPPADNGRLIEWFADSNYSGVCIIYGPTTGGDPGTSHHVGGHGGLQQPGIMASDRQGNIYVPVDATVPGQLHSQGANLVPRGAVLKFAASELPKTEAGCPNTSRGRANGDQTNYHVVSPTTFIDAAAAGIPLPGAIAWDPSCRPSMGSTGCWAVDNIFALSAPPLPGGVPPIAVEWFDTSGRPVSPSVHAPILANVDGSGFTPFGMAFDRDGNLFVVDIHVQLTPEGLASGSVAGPVDGQGRLLEFTFNGPIANAPRVIASGESYPVSVTTCDPNAYKHCPVGYRVNEVR